MAELRARLKPLFRRSSTTTTTSSKSSTSSNILAGVAFDPRRPHSKSSLLLPRTRRKSIPESVHEEESRLPLPPRSILDPELQPQNDDVSETPNTSLETPRLTPLEKVNPTLTVEKPTPDLTPAVPDRVSTTEPPAAESTVKTPPTLPRRQSLAHNNQGRFLSTLLESDKASSSDYFGPPTVSANMLHRKIWVKRPGQSATMVTINEEDLVDDARDMILKKYANSLGRHFDAPDLTLRILPRSPGHRHAKGERTLGPEEQLSRTLDAYYPGGQNVDDALVIDVPQRRTPRHSPRVPMQYYVNDELRPSESGGDYFSTIPIQGQHSPRLPSHVAVAAAHGPSHPPLAHAATMASTGQAVALPSPGGLGTRHPSSNSSRSQRPRNPRQSTASPTIFGITKSSTHDSLKSHPVNIPAPPPLPSPQIPADGQPLVDHTATPDRVASPRPTKGTKKSKKAANAAPTLPAGLLDGTVPPINVLIVEDNIINLKLLEAFMKRLKVRWQTAMNGKDAVNKWRQGGFHLVLMDIQLPVMNGLDATKEIRRLERLNKIGVFSNSAASTPTFASSIQELSEGGEKDNDAPKDEDSLMTTALFKSPVIIVALTASSLQSDRHEALAAGCNDFLTKPVNFVWLERKVMEWGCMQALIDFDGWRKWKDFSQTQPNTSNNNNNKTSPSSLDKNAKAGANKDSGGVGANGAVVKGERRKSLALLNTGGGKKGSSGTAGSTSGSGSGSEGPANVNVGAA
ncbi:MAG: hypothetical protein Q9179_002433 [Wetmoreana sp. 5 TL-2023]